MEKVNYVIISCVLSLAMSEQVYKSIKVSLITNTCADPENSVRVCVCVGGGGGHVNFKCFSRVVRTRFFLRKTIATRDFPVGGGPTATNINAI